MVSKRLLKKRGFQKAKQLLLPLLLDLQHILTSLAAGENHTQHAISQKKSRCMFANKNITGPKGSYPFGTKKQLHTVILKRVQK